MKAHDNNDKNIIKNNPIFKFITTPFLALYV